MCSSVLLIRPNHHCLQCVIDSSDFSVTHREEEAASALQNAVVANGSEEDEPLLAQGMDTTQPVLEPP